MSQRVHINLNCNIWENIHSFWPNWAVIWHSIQWFLAMSLLYIMPFGNKVTHKKSPQNLNRLWSVFYSRVQLCRGLVTWICWLLLSLECHLIFWWSWRALISVQAGACSLLVEAAGMGSGWAAQLVSPRGCNHLQQHVLITKSCLDYHTMLNGTLP